MAKRKPTGVSPKFAVEEKVHVKPGTIDPDFPDVPVGGWSGTIIEIGRRQPRTYLMKLSQETIRSVHPIYRKRCVRDGLDPGEGHREGPSWRGRPEVLCAQARIPYTSGYSRSYVSRSISPGSHCYRAGIPKIWLLPLPDMIFGMDSVSIRYTHWSKCCRNRKVYISRHVISP